MGRDVSWEREEQLTERRRNRGWFRKDQPLPYDPTEHEPTPEDRRVEKPLPEEN